MQSIVVFLTVVLSAWSCFAREVTVTTNNNRQITGELISESDEQVTLSIEGITTPIPRSEIKAIEYVRGIEERYAQKRTAIADNDVDGRYQLAKWLVENGALGLAVKELSELETLRSDEARFSLLKRIVEEKLKAAPTTDDVVAGNPPRASAAEQPMGVGKPAVAAAQSEKKLKRLSQQQINLLRVYEADFTAAPPPRVVVPKQALSDLYSEYAHMPGVPQTNAEKRAFSRLPGWEQLKLILEAQATTLYDKVTVKDESPALRVFRTRIHHQYVLSYCATNQCHGGAEGAVFPLFNSRVSDIETAYTNFYLLSSHTNDSDHMIDRENPGKSLLIQYGMPAKAASPPHPEVSGWKPKILKEDDPTHGIIIDWIKHLQPGVKTYPIQYNHAAGSVGKETPADATEDSPHTNPNEPTPN